MPYYINAPTLSSATAIYTNAEMTICAPDGYYSDGPIVRRQVGCVLLPAQECPYCGVDCAVGFEGNVNQGVYYFNVRLGIAVGPVLIQFDPKKAPNGIQVIYDSTIYNQLVSPTFGMLAAPAGLPTFVGLDTEDCGLVGSHTLPEFEYVGTPNLFNNLGSTDVVNIISSQLNLTTADPGLCSMIIPKFTSTPSDLLVKVISPCPLDEFAIGITCPKTITVFEIDGSEGAPLNLICGYPSGTEVYYVFPVNGDGITLGLYDFVCYDSNLSLPLPDNYYLSDACPSPNNWFRIENGIITEFGECESLFKYNVSRCGSSILVVVSSSFPLTLDSLVTLSDPIYDGCKFAVKSVNTIDTPVTSVVNQYLGQTCANVCLYYKITNESAKPVSIQYNNCSGTLSSTTVPANSFIYICALTGTVLGPSTIKVTFEDCQCPS